MSPPRLSYVWDGDCMVESYMLDVPTPDDVNTEFTGSFGNSQHAEFVRLMVEHQQCVRTYVLSLVPHWADAEEIVQETFVRIWEQHGQWDPNRSFRAWACTIAYYQVLTFRKHTRRRRDVQLSQSFVEAVVAELESTSETVRQRREALSECLGKLNSAEQQLLELVYHSGQAAQDVAQALSYTVDVVYKRLSRVRKSLHNCINRRIRDGNANDENA